MQPNVQKIARNDKNKPYEQLSVRLPSGQLADYQKEDADEYQRIMIFCNTKFMTDKLTSRLIKEGYNAQCLRRYPPVKTERGDE